MPREPPGGYRWLTARSLIFCRIVKTDTIQDEALLQYYAGEWESLHSFSGKIIFIPVQRKHTKLASAILRLIELQRNGETIDQVLVKKVVDSLVSLGLDETDPNKTCIREHSKLMWENFQSLLDFDKDEDLQRMYALLSRIPEGLELLRKKFEEHVKKAGLAAVAKLVDGEGAGGDAHAEAINPKAYVDALLDVHKKNSETVVRSFRGEAGFVASLDKACREFVNRNAATGASNSKSPELLAKHADLLLRKNNKMVEEDDLEAALNRVMVLFKYIEDKDVFQQFYTTKLSKRLIHGVSASDESEASMISKLKEACGFEYTNKWQRIFTDMSLSKDLTDQFKDRMTQNHDDMDINFSIMVLGTNFWPLNPPNHEFMKHSGRKLTWLWNYSKNELRTNYPNQKYILMTSSFQMAVLFQYNRNNTLSLAELEAAKGFVVEVISQISQRFAPKIPDLKKAIDTLLEKEYIERVEGTRDTFAYIA
ncbi:Cullin [Mycena sanguinolenta]|nr:Cullin [Mycena sanguinolenta]